MRLLVSVFAVCAAVATSASAAGPRFSYQVLGGDPGPWPAILGSIGLVPGAGDVVVNVVVAPSGTDASFAEWSARVDGGVILIMEGESPLAAAFGFKPTASAGVPVRSVEDLRSPDLRIIWEQALDVPLFALPAAARVFARERWQKAPLLAGYRRGEGAVLWISVPPGPAGASGYERFPYIPQALADLGLEAPFRSARLWAFFDSAYRSRVDLDYFAERWRSAGISALHVAAWHFWERDPQSDEYLRQLINACHRHAILVYAWFELPHVSDKFWDAHPEWREKTALLQDAQLDWRKLVNLTNRAAFTAVSAGVTDLVTRFDWDGVNLAELYFESLEGHDNPARLTPMNDDVRAEFKEISGLDPLDLFNPQSPHYWTRNSPALARFLDYRADLARRQQTEWIAQIEAIRKVKPHLDLVLTHIDDRFDPTMREKLGADTARVLPLLQQHDFTFLIEDPATIWNLGPRRYPQIVARYSPLTPAQQKLAIDINIVERYQDVYPTKQQTGAELFELLHAAANSFPRVALYFENSILRPDLPWLSAAATTVQRAALTGGAFRIESSSGTGVQWKGPAMVDGKLWAMVTGKTVWLPGGAHTIEAALNFAPLRLLDLNADLKSARATADGVDFVYSSSARALALADPAPLRVEVDGIAVTPQFFDHVLVLPRGQHLVSLSLSK